MVGVGSVVAWMLLQPLAVLFCLDTGPPSYWWLGQSQQGLLQKCFVVVQEVSGRSTGAEAAAGHVQECPQGAA